MRYTSFFLIIFCLFVVTQSAIAAEPAARGKNIELPPSKPEIKKEPRSLIGVDPYDIDGSGVLDPFDVNGNSLDPLDLLGEEPIDSYDVDNGRHQDPNDVRPVPAEAPVKPERLQPPKIYKDLKNALQAWWAKPPEPQPDVTLSELGSEIGAGYVGAFGGSVIGLFGGFIVGSLYGELANCSRCWLDIATGGSVLGTSLLTSTGVYMFGNNEQQLGTFTSTAAWSLVPVVLAEGFYRESKQVRKSGFYLLTMPLFATLGYNISRHYRKPGEEPIFNNIFYDDTWVSADPVNGTVALNISVRF